MNVVSSFGPGGVAAFSSTPTVWCVGVGPMHPPKLLGERVDLKPSPASTSAAVSSPQALFVCTVAAFAAPAHAMRTAAVIAERTKHSTFLFGVIMRSPFIHPGLYAAIEN